MTDSPRHQTTSYSSKENPSLSHLPEPPKAAHVSYNPQIVGNRYGWVTIISPEKRWSKNWNHCKVLTRCNGCGKIAWTELGNLQRGLSNGCQRCSQPRQIPRWLYKRLTAAKQRCVNPATPEWENYGARGIQFCFPSVTAAGLYLIKTCGKPDRSMEIDRIDTNGNYAPGNIRFATHQENQQNKLGTVLSRFEQRYWPYAYTVVIRKLSKGLSRAEIIKNAQTAVREKRKNWPIISARLDFMTYEMPDSIIVLPYRENSSTTAAMAAPSAH